MPIDVDALLAHDFGSTRHSYTERDAILYALGVGLPTRWTDENELRFLDETRLTVLPTFAVTLATPGMWIRDPRFGVDFSKLVHLAQEANFYAPLPPRTQVVGEARIDSITDRGEGRGAELVVERTIHDAVNERLYCSLRQTLLLRGDGGFGGKAAARTASIIPDTDPDATFTVTLSQRAALIYRLSGDLNPLHINPTFARSAGFDTPIMHGFGVYGMAAIAVSHVLGAEPDSLASLSCRFSGVVVPGDAIRFSVWRAGDEALFTASVGEWRVLDQGRLVVEAQR